MSGRGRGVGRKRRQPSPTSKAKKTRQEREKDENVVLLDSPENPSGNSRIVDFEKLISESLGIDATENNLNRPTLGDNHQDNFVDRPQLMRCGGDNLGMLVTDNVQTKIKQNEYVNLASLLRCTMEGKDPQQETLIGFDERGNIVTKPKSLTEKIMTIEQWTDAFFVYSSIYLSAHPDQTQDLLQYMFVIREAARKHDGDQWRTYDEQFRLRQGTSFTPWSRINSDLWLRCFSGTNKLSPRPFADSQAKMPPPPCIDFNKGFCQWKSCRFPHVCAICSSAQHGRWRCRMSTPSNVANNFRGSFRPTYKGWARGATRGKRT